MEETVIDMRRYGTVVKDGFVVVRREQDGNIVFRGKVNYKAIQELTTDKIRVIREKTLQLQDRVNDEIDSYVKFLDTFIENFSGKRWVNQDNV